MKNQFKIGDKVKIISKSVGGNLENSNVYQRGKKTGDWWIADILGDGSGRDEDNCLMIIANHRGASGRGCFAPQDLVKIESKMKKNTKKQNKVISGDENTLTDKVKKEILEEFRKARTDAISEMFDNPYDVGIYPTTKFFNVLDNFLSHAIDRVREEK